MSSGAVADDQEIASGWLTLELTSTRTNERHIGAPHTSSGSRDRYEPCGYRSHSWEHKERGDECARKPSRLGRQPTKRREPRARNDRAVNRDHAADNHEWCAHRGSVGAQGDPHEDGALNETASDSGSQEPPWHSRVSYITRHTQ